MADSKDKRNESSDDEFADDLDAMLSDAESSMGVVDEQVDDEDVIDRLLMDDTFDVDSDSESKTDDEFSADEQVYSNIEESNSNTMAEIQEDEIDEFAVDDLIDSVASTSEGKAVEEVDEFADDDEFDVDSLLDSVDVEKDDKDKYSETESSQLQQEPTEREDEFDIDDLIDSTAGKVEEDGGEEEISSVDDDFLMADFDISADDNEMLEVDQVDELESVEKTKVEQDPEPVKVEQTPTPGEYINELNAHKAVVTQTNEDLAQVNGAITELKKQVAQTLADNEALKNLITELTTVTTEKDDSALEEIDLIQKDQRRLKKAIKEGEDKVPAIVYVVMGIAILALLIGSGLGMVGYGAKTDVENLAESILSLEEEVEIINAKDNSKQFQEIDFKVNQLKIKVGELEIQLAALLKEEQRPKSNSLQTVVDDLVIQNAHAQKAIEKLLADVEVLEQKVVISEAARKRAIRAKKINAQVKWVVNLVSFKQEWYAKRKAEEFKKKGVAAVVERVVVNGETWFRLRVKNFKSKYEAAAYAVKVKKILNLSSVWVTKA